MKRNLTNEEMLRVARDALELNSLLLDRLQEAELIIQEFVEIYDREDERWKGLCEIAGGEAQARRLQAEARKWLVLHEHGKQSMKVINDRKAITPEEMGNVQKLNCELEQSIPKPTPRYTEIAVRLDMKARRVRHIIEKYISNE